jgi:hypothetical protein
MTGHIWAILDEVVISRVVGDAVVMRDQLAHLLDLIDKGRIRLQIIPASLTNHPGLCTPFRIFDLAEGTVVHTEDSYGGSSYRDPAKVDSMRDLFGALQSEGYAPEASARLLRSMVRGDEHHE